jgi:DNA-binding transcriptional LysR family regulator
MSRPLNFKQVEAFRAVMLTGTTTGAARMLHTTQPYISRLIGQIQSASGIRLFDMQNGRLRPTVEAHELFDTIQRQFLGLERIEAKVDALRQSGSGSLRVGCTPSLGLGIVPSAISLFSARHPDARINLQTLGSHYLRDGLQHGMFDLALTTTAMGDKSFHEECIHQSGAVCVTRPDHTLVKKKKIQARDLSGCLLLTLNADDELSISLQNLLSAQKVCPSSHIETTYSSTICSLAARSNGVGFVNEYVAEVFADQLAILPFHPRIAVEMYLAYPPQRAPSRLAEIFGGIVRDILASGASTHDVSGH